MNIKHMTFFILLFLSSSLIGASENNSLQLMTFNIRRQGKEAHAKNLWHNRKVRVTSAIKTARPDIMGLQEATIDQIKDIDQALKSEHYAWLGMGRGSEWFGTTANEYNPIFYNTARLEHLNSGTFVLNPSGFLNLKFLFKPKKVGLLTRICTWGKFKDKETGLVFYVYNTHLDHKYQSARLHGLRAITKAMSRSKEKLPTILMGDFNMEMTPQLFTAQLHDFKNTLDYAHSKVGPHETRTGWYFEELKKIDHILVSKHAPVTIERHAVLAETDKDILLSDHRPVLVDLKFVRQA